jgi:signal transduction histidine kinase
MSRAERMESIGQLAGGVAHDFNNLLSVIINYAGFVKETAADSSVQPDADRWQSVTDDVAQIERAAVRATELTQQLLAFARRETVRPESVDINGLVKEVSQFLHRTLGEEVELRAALAPSLRLVEIDPGKLEQVLVNLAVNARDAMRDGGTLTITTENFEIGAGDSSFPGVPPGPAVRLQVADTGAGMEDDVIERAFEPFFTTKPAGVGTGLGLATVYGIITSAGGALRIDSGVGAGTTFTVVLPEAPAPPVRE